MGKNTKRILKVLMTLLTVASSLSVYAITPPDDLRVQGHIVGADWGSGKLQDVRIDNEFYFFVKSSISGDWFWFDFKTGKNDSDGAVTEYLYGDETEGDDSDGALTAGDDTFVKARQVKPLVGGGSDRKFKLKPGSYTLKVVFLANEDEPELWVRREGFVPEQLYLIGAFEGYGWHNGKEADSVNEGIFEYKNITFTETATFGFSKTGRQELPYFGNAGRDIDLMPGMSYPMSIVFGGAWRMYPGTYDITVDFSNPDAPVVSAVPAEVYLIGDFNGGGWNNGNGMIATRTSSNIFEFKGVDFWGDGKSFGFSRTNKQDRPYWGIMKGEDYYDKDVTGEYGLAQKLNYGDGGGLKVNSGTYDITLDFSGSDGPAAIVLPSKLYLIGHTTGTSKDRWGWDAGVEAVKNGSKYYFDDVYLQGYDKEDGSRSELSFFAFSTSDRQKAQNSSDIIAYYSPGGNDKEISVTETDPISFSRSKSNEGSWKIKNGNYDIAVDFSGETPSFTIVEHESPYLTECPSSLYFIAKDKDGNWTIPVKGVKNEAESQFSFEIDVNGTDFVFSETDIKGERYFGPPTGASDAYVKIKQPIPFSSERVGYWHLSTNYKYRIIVDFSNLVSPVFTVYRVNSDGEEYKPVPDNLYIIGQGGEKFSWTKGMAATERVGDVFKFKDVNFVGADGSVNSSFAFSSTEEKKDIYYTNPWAITNRPIVYDTPMDLGIGQAGNWIIQNSGLCDITVSFEDNENPTVTIKHKIGNPEMPEELYIIGDLSMNTIPSNWYTGMLYTSSVMVEDESGHDVQVGYIFKNVEFKGKKDENNNYHLPTFAFTKVTEGKGGYFYGANELGETDESADEGMVNKMKYVPEDSGKAWFVEDGTYDVVVYFNDPNDPYFVFYVSEPDYPSAYDGPGTVPDHLFLIGAVGSDDNNWDSPRSYVEPTRVDEKTGKIYFDNVYIHGQIGFSTDADHANHTPDDCRKTVNFWGAMNPNITAATGNVNYLYTRAAGNDATTGNGYTLQNGKGRYNITVTFGKRPDGKQGRPYFTYEFIPSYYFIGDINNWFSKEFEGDDQPRGIDKGLFEARYSWQFEPVFVDENGNVLTDANIGDAKQVIKTEWYKFDKFPGHLLSGQFKIVTDGGWDGTDYCHKQCVDPNSMSGAGITPQSLFEAYISRPITRDMIRKANFTDYYHDMNGNVLTDETVPEEFTNARYGVFTDLIRNGREAVVTGAGGNFHLESNAVKDAVIYFKPGETDPKIIIDGEPLDYYIFYGMKKDDNGDGLVTAKMQNDKPNSNNYFMPGINGLLPVGNEAHMAHAQGIDLVKITLKDENRKDVSQADLLEQLKEIIPNSVDLDYIGTTDYFNTLDSNSQIVANLLGINDNVGRVLPNMFYVGDMDEIYITKVPSGYENPAGEKYMFNFINALESETKETSHSLTTAHKYYFPNQGGVHVHAWVNDDDSGASYEISYRVYYVHSDYNTYIVGTDHFWPGDGVSEADKNGRNIGRSVALKKTAQDSGDAKDYGWVALDTKNAVDQSTWLGGARAPHNYMRTEWYVANKPAETPAAGPRKANAQDPSDPRLAIRSRFGNAGLVQYRITSKVGDQVYNTVYYPETPDQQAAAGDKYYPMNSQDVYALFNNENGLLTAVDDFMDDGIVDAEEAKGEVIWYNLQGQRVSNPGNGIFIRVQGKTSKKILVK